jgi:hypothetical protein
VGLRRSVRHNNARGGLDWLLSVDSMIVPARQHAVGAPPAPGAGGMLE